MPGANFVGGRWWRERGCSGSPVTWHCRRRQRTPRAPPAEAVLPCWANPLLLRINQLHSAGPYCAVKAPVHPPTTTPATTSLHPPSLPCTHTLIHLHPHYPLMVPLSLLNYLCICASYSSFTTDPVYFTSQLTIFQTTLLSFMHLNFWISVFFFLPAIRLLTFIPAQYEKLLKLVWVA